MKSLDFKNNRWIPFLVVLLLHSFPGYTVLAIEPSQDPEIHRLLKEANDLRHHFNRPADVDRAEELYHNILFMHPEDRAVISEANLGLAKISNRKGHYEAASEFARNSIITGNPNDLHTLAWIASSPHFGPLEKSGMAQRLMTLKQNDCTRKDRPFLERFQIMGLIGLGNARVDRQNNFERARNIAHRIGDQVLEAQALISLGNARVDGQNNYERARDIARSIGDQTLEAQALIGLGNARVDSQNNHERARDIARSIGDQTLEAQALIGLGNAWIDQPNNYERARNIAHLIGDQTLEAQALIGLGNARVDRQNNYERARSIARRIGDQILEAQALIGLGNAQLDADRQKNYERARDIARSIGDQTLEAQALIGLGNMQVDSKNNYERARSIAIRIGDQALEVQALIGLGNFASAMRQTREAIEYYQSARELNRNPAIRERISASIARCMRFLGQ